MRAPATHTSTYLQSQIIAAWIMATIATSGPCCSKPKPPPQATAMRVSPAITGFALRPPPPERHHVEPLLPVADAQLAPLSTPNPPTTINSFNSLPNLQFFSLSLSAFILQHINPIIPLN